MRTPIPIPLPKRGVIRSMGDEEVPFDAARDAENWIPRDQEFRVRPGLTTFGDDINQRPCAFAGYDNDDGTRRIVMGTDDGWWAYDTGTNTWTDISGTALTATQQQIVFRPFQRGTTTYLLGVNGVDSNKTWDSDTANNYAAMGGSPPIARCMMILANRILLGNLKSGGTVSPVAVDVSSRLDFDAGWQTFISLLADTVGEIVAMQEMGVLQGVVYKTDAIYVVIAQGNTDAPFRYQLVKTFKEGEGPASTLAVSPIGDGTHIILSRDADIKQFNGADYISKWEHVGAYLRQVVNIATIGRSWVAYDSENEEILVVYPEKGNAEPNAGIIIKERTGSMWPIRWTSKNMTAGGFAPVARGIRIGDLTMPIGSISQTLGELGSAGMARRVILGEAGGQVYESVGNDDAGTAIPFHLETGLNALTDGTRVKTVQRLQHRFTKIASSQTVTVKIGKSFNGENRTLSDAQTINIGSIGPYNTGARVSSKFMSIRFEGSASAPISWKGSYADYKQRGYR